MTEVLEKIRPQISEKIFTILRNYVETNVLYSSFSPDITKKLSEYSLRGKMIRGSLVPLVFSSLTQDESLYDHALSLGAVMELVQSMLLIHDDIMDQDKLRRGKPAIHAQYEEEAEKNNYRDFKRYGESMGICLGDVAGFISFQIVVELSIPDNLKNRILHILSKELVCVGLAQMDDVANGHRLVEPDIDDIIRLYRFKTGRYTFSLPLLLALELEGSSSEVLKTRISELGEIFGILFQIRDDAIGLFSDSKQSGKAKGNDLIEDKKTLYRFFLKQKSRGHEALLNRVYGNKEATETDKDLLLNLHKILGVEDEVYSYYQQFEARGLELIAEITQEKPALSEILENLLAYIGRRTH